MRRPHPAALARLVAAGLSVATSVVLVIAFARSDATPDRATTGGTPVPETRTPGPTPGAQPGRPSHGRPITQTRAS